MSRSSPIFYFIFKMLTISKYHLIIKDSEGYVFKKLESEVSPDEKIISEKEYMKVSGLTSYEKKFGHGGAREHNINYSALMQM